MAQSAFMKRLRDSMKWIFIVVIVLFVASMVFQRGMGGRRAKNTNDNALGVVNGNPIEARDYSSNVEQEVASARERDKNLKEGDVSQIRERVWLDMVNRLLIKDEVEAKEIVVGDKEITEEVRLNPPDFLKQQPEFQVNGQFDYNEFLTYAKSPNADARFLSILQQQTHNSLIDSKLQQIIKSMAFVTRHEALEEIFAGESKVRAKYMRFTANSHLDEVPENPSTETLKKYYEENISDYDMDPGAIFDWVMVPLEISSSDSAEAKSLIDTLAYMLSTGEDFVDIATRFSQDPSGAQNQGQLGWVTRGRLVPEFENVIFSLDSGEVSEPFLTQFGWHIAKVNDKIDSLDAVFASHILIQIVPSYETIDSVSQIADNIRAEAAVSNLKKAANTYNYEAIHSDVIGANDAIPGLGYNSQIIDFGMKDTIGAVYDVVASPDGYFILQLADRFDKGVPEFSKIKNKVLKDYRKDMATRYAFKEATEVYTAVKQAEGFDGSGYTADTTGWTTPISFIPEIGYDPSFSGVLMGLKPNTLSSVIEGKDASAYYIIEMLERENFNSDGIQDRLQQTYRKMLAQKRDLIFNQWFLNIRDHAEITDRRNEVWR